MAFVPTDISALAQWLDPHQLGLSDGASVSTWAARVGTDATIAAGDEPTYRDGSDTYPGKAEVRFESTAAKIAIPQPKSLSAAGSWAVAFRFRADILARGSDTFFVLNEDSGGTAQSFALKWSGTSNEQFELAGRDSAGTYSDSAGSPSSVYPVQRFFLITYDGTDYKLYIDNWGLTAPLATLTIASEMTGSGNLYLSNHPTVDTGSARGAWGDVMEFDAIPSQSDLDSLLSWFESKWNAPARTKRLGSSQDGAHNIPATATGTEYGSVNIRPNPDGVNYDMIAEDRSAETLHWFQAHKDNPHNWTHMNSGLPILNPTERSRGGSFVWFGGTLHVYYEHRSSGEIGLATGSNFDSLTDQGIILSDATLFYRHPEAWVRDGKVFMLIDVREGSSTSGNGYIAATNSADGQTSWAALHTLVDHSSVENGIADDCGAPSIIVLDETTGETMVVFAGFNVDYRSGHPAAPHSIWLATFTNPMSDTASIVKDGAIMAGELGTDGEDAYAQNAPEFYDRRSTGGPVDYYVDGLDSSENTWLVAFRDQEVKTNAAGWLRPSVALFPLLMDEPVNEYAVLAGQIPQPPAKRCADATYDRTATANATYERVVTASATWDDCS